MSSKIKVAVLRGGPSSAYQDSLKTGAYALSLLREMPERYEPLDVFISRDGEWHQAGLKDEPHAILRGADVAWNALHAEYGEDGGIQRLLESLQMPFTGSLAAPAAFAYHKDIAKGIYLNHSLLTPPHEVLREENTTDAEIMKVFRGFLLPVIVKPTTGARAAGIHLVRSFDELKKAVRSVFLRSPKAIVEQYVGGTVASCSVIESVKGEDLYALLPAHLDTERRRVRPSTEENRLMEEMAKEAHRALGLRHYSSSDFIITPKGKVYILETNSHPVLHEDSLTHRSLESTGWQPKDFADHILNLALEREA